MLTEWGAGHEVRVRQKTPNNYEIQYVITRLFAGDSTHRKRDWLLVTQAWLLVTQHIENLSWLLVTQAWLLVTQDIGNVTGYWYLNTLKT